MIASTEGALPSEPRGRHSCGRMARKRANSINDICCATSSGCSESSSTLSMRFGGSTGVAPLCWRSVPKRGVADERRGLEESWAAGDDDDSNDDDNPAVALPSSEAFSSAVATLSDCNDEAGRGPLLLLQLLTDEALSERVAVLPLPTTAESAATAVRLVAPPESLPLSGWPSESSTSSLRRSSDSSEGITKDHDCSGWFPLPSTREPSWRTSGSIKASARRVVLLSSGKSTSTKSSIQVRRMCRMRSCVTVSARRLRLPESTAAAWNLDINDSSRMSGSQYCRAFSKKACRQFWSVFRTTNHSSRAVTVPPTGTPLLCSTRPSTCRLTSSLSEFSG
mmetsp:Transcript_6210/g.18886  ORF Transcript_6210/g.18886 Transcript_6210/m.18886 type:complete len:337 (-) Transcript_6210:520-1530(-)